MDRVLHYVGAYHLKLHADVDALVFAGGIGEKSVELRNMVSERVECLGYRKVDQHTNENLGEEEVVDISEDKEGKGKILVVKTDEQVCLIFFSRDQICGDLHIVLSQLEMARECALEPKFWN